MTADVELLPLPAIERWEVTGDYAFPTATDPEGHAVDYDDHVDAMQSYARANVAHATAAKDAVIVDLQSTIEALRAEVGRLQELCNGLHRSLTDSQSGFVHYRGRAERLAGALRDVMGWVSTDNYFTDEPMQALARARAALHPTAAQGDEAAPA